MTSPMRRILILTLSAGLLHFAVGCDGGSESSEQAPAAAAEQQSGSDAATTTSQQTAGRTGEREIIPTPIDPPIPAGQVIADNTQPAPTGEQTAVQPGPQPSASGQDVGQLGEGSQGKNLIIRAYEHAGMIWHADLQENLYELGRLQWSGGLAPPPMRERSEYLPYRRRVASAYQATGRLIANWRQIRERSMDYMLSEGYRFTRADALTDAVCELVNYERDLLRWQMLERILFLHYKRVETLAPYMSQWRIDPVTLKTDMTDQIPVEAQDRVFEIEEELLKLEEQLQLEQDFLRPPDELLNPEEPIEVPEGLGIETQPAGGGESGR